MDRAAASRQSRESSRSPPSTICCPSDNLTSTTISAIAKQVADEATINVVPPNLSVTFRIEPSDVSVPSRQATILALLINECLTNAIEHGMRERTRGTVTVSAQLDEGVIEVIVEDDGVGLPDGLRTATSAIRSDCASPAH